MFTGIIVIIIIIIQGWGQFNSGIGIAGQFQFQFRNWNWNWNGWNWKWNWNWNPWNWNWNWKPELILQLLLQHLLVNQPFQILALTEEAMSIHVTDSCNRYVLGTLPPVVWSQKTHGEGTLFPLSRQRLEGLKMVTMDISLPPWNKQNYYHCWINE